mmetsp:Transcript_55069/g.91432  ORF Transcript_55069/g.91432 Transcript_55069/m.91432 type:complete len:535 (+) Transcript_55069:1008-2612(+)
MRQHFGHKRLKRGAQRGKQLLVGEQSTVARDPLLLAVHRVGQKLHHAQTRHGRNLQALDERRHTHGRTATRRKLLLRGAHVQQLLAIRLRLARNVLALNQVLQRVANRVLHIERGRLHRVQQTLHDALDARVGRSVARVIRNLLHHARRKNDVSLSNPVRLLRALVLQLVVNRVQSHKYLRTQTGAMRFKQGAPRVQILLVHVVVGFAQSKAQQKIQNRQHIRLLQVAQVSNLGQTDTHAVPKRPLANLGLPRHIVLVHRHKLILVRLVLGNQFVHRSLSKRRLSLAAATTTKRAQRRSNRRAHLGARIAHTTNHALQQRLAQATLALPPNRSGGAGNRLLLAHIVAQNPQPTRHQITLRIQHALVAGQRTQGRHSHLAIRGQTALAMQKRTQLTRLQFELPSLRRLLRCLVVVAHNRSFGLLAHRRTQRTQSVLDGFVAKRIKGNALQQHQRHFVRGKAHHIAIAIGSAMEVVVTVVNDHAQQPVGKQAVHFVPELVVAFRVNELRQTRLHHGKQHGKTRHTPPLRSVIRLRK